VFCRDCKYFSREVKDIILPIDHALCALKLPKLKVAYGREKSDRCPDFEPKEILNEEQEY